MKLFDKYSNDELIILTTYVLNFITLSLGFTGIVSVILNFIYRKKTEQDWLKSHHQWQITTALYTLLWLTVSCLCLGIFIAFGHLRSSLISLLGLLALITLSGTAIWYFYRNVRGFYRFRQKLLMNPPLKR